MEGIFEVPREADDKPLAEEIEKVVRSELMSQGEQD
jgi:hypothetical protein